MAEIDLLPAERRAWRALSGVLTRLPSVLDAQLAKDAGLTLFEYTALAELSAAQPRRLPMSVLAERAHGSLSRTSHVMRRLESQGLVRRQPHGQDRRVTEVVLLPEGARRVRRATPGHTDRVRALLVEGVEPADLAAFTLVGEHVLDRLTGASASLGRRDR